MPPLQKYKFLDQGKMCTVLEFCKCIQVIKFHVDRDLCASLNGSMPT